MKKIFFLLIGLILALGIQGQTLEEIVKKNVAAMKYEKLAAVNTIKIIGTMSTMNMEVPMTMFMKIPNKIKIVYNFSGQDMVSVFDGEKGYMINPGTGSNDLVELTGEQLRELQDYNIFKNQLLDYFKSGKLTLVGEENVNDKPAFKIKAEEGISPVYMFIDKESYLVVKKSTTVEQMLEFINIDSFMSDYSDSNGVVIPMKTTVMANGMASVFKFDKIDKNISIDDSVFKLK